MPLEVVEHGGISYAVIPKDEFDRLMRHYQMMMDVLAHDRVKGAEKEEYPLELTHSLVNGKNPIRAFRQYRNLSQVALARQLGLSKAYLSELEHGKKEPSVKVLKALAAALNVNMEELII